MTPLQRIETLSEINELPPGSIVRAAFPAGAMEKLDKNRWWAAGTHVTYNPSLVPLPAFLLWVPEWEKEQ